MTIADHAPLPRPPVHWLQEHARERPDAPAILAGGATISYGDLYARAAALAQVLSRRGVMPGTVLASESASAVLTALLVHAAPLLGCALLPLNPALPATCRAALLRQADAAGLIADTAATGGRRPLLSSALLGDLRDASGTPPPAAPLDLEDIHLIVATSGSSGEPKGVMLTGRNIAASVRASRDRLGLEPGDRWLACLPLFHVGGLSILYRCAEVGATVLLHERFDAQRVLTDIDTHAITHISLVPTMLARLLECAGDAPAPASLRRVLVGGAALPSALARRARAAGWPVCASYGMSEAGSQVATLCPLPADWSGGLVGRPLAGIEVAIEASTAGGAGRIRIRGDVVMAGYVNPERRAGDGLKDGWFETSDLGRLDAEGNLIVLGRADDMLVSGGENVSPQLVEDLIAACPGVAEVGVTARPDEVWGDRIVAVFAGTIDAAALEAWCRVRLAGALRPREFIRVAALPRNAAGKLDRRALRELLGPAR